MSLGPGIPYRICLLDQWFAQDQRWRPAKGAPEVPQVPVGQWMKFLGNKQGFGKCPNLIQPRVDFKRGHL